jgi:hypothetical protein
MKAYPYKPLKLTGYVMEVSPRLVQVKLFWGAEEFYATVERKAFGPDAQRLVEGHLISLPARRDARWIIMPVRPLTHRDIKRAEAWARKIKKELSRYE